MQHLTIAWYDLVSIVGVVIVLVTYFLLQCGKMDSNGYSYSLWNILGSILILYSLMYEWNLAAVTIEVFWVFISVVGIVRRYLRDAKLKNL